MPGQSTCGFQSWSGPEPALAVVWSFLLLSETVRGWQIVGIAVAIGGLAAFLVLNRRGDRSLGTDEMVVPPIAGESPALRV